MTEAQFVSGQAQTALYTYDADGRRVKRKIGAGSEVWQVYGLGGELVAEYAAGAAPAAPQQEYGYRGGELLVTAEAGAAALAVGNSGFEAPAVGGGSYQYNPAGGSWTFAGGTGVSGNSSPFTSGNPAAPEGAQVAFIQGGNTSIMSQSVSGFQSGVSYAVRFKAARRGNCCGAHDFDVYLDTTFLGTFTTTGTPYQEMSTASFTTTAGAHVLKFVGRNTAGGDNTSFVDEVRVAAAAGGGVKWLVSDQLGTPRMVVDQTGSLAGISRHDYFPFGEEIGAGIGGRTTAQGYGQFDGNRKKWAMLERDGETGLDYAQARYYASSQGRFTGVDPLIGSVKATLPQSWNRYTYCLNNPLRYVDPTGLIWGYREFQQDGKWMREFQWFDGDKVGDGYTAYTAPTYTFGAGDGRTVWLDPESSNYQWITDHTEVRANLYDSVEVIVWDSTFPAPPISGWGGHVSYNINGQSWSWERHGWADPQSIEAYLQHNTYRSGTGYVLDGGGAWNRQLAEGIMGGYNNVDNGIVLPWFEPGYNVVQNNCGEAFCRAVNNAGGLPRNTSISPAAHGEYIRNNMGSFIQQINRYPKAQVTLPPDFQIGPMQGGP